MPTIIAPPMELQLHHTYEAKRSGPAADGFINDRMIVWMGLDKVQYDSPSVPDGRRLPIVTREAFLKWAKRDITDEMPKGEWRQS